MSALRRAIPAILLLLLLPLFWIGAFRAGSELSALPGCVFLRYHTGQATPEGLERIKKSEAENEQAVSFSAFAQLDAQPVQGKLYGREAQADILLFDGDIRLILGTGISDTGFAFSADEKGCALDRDTAFALWGSDQVTGETLLFRGTEFTVRAVFDVPVRTAVIPASQADTLSVLALRPPAGQDGRLAAEQFYQRHGLSVPDAVTSGSWYYLVSRFFCLLPALLPLGALVIAISRELWGMRKTPVFCILWSLAAAALLAGCIWISGVRLSFPQGMVPTRWSDFEFWSRLFHSFFENLRSILLMPVLAPDRMAGAALVKLTSCSLLAAADMAVLMVFYRRRAGGGG